MCALCVLSAGKKNNPKKKTPGGTPLEATSASWNLAKEIQL